MLHRVTQGECLNSIAHRFGFADYRTIYDHPQNADFKKQRPNPNVIRAGDLIFIPPKQSKQTDCATEQQHQFKVKTPKVDIQVYVELNEEGFANKNYTLTAGTFTTTGTTTGAGLVQTRVPITATTALLTFDDDPVSLILDLGHLDPITEISGVQGRLNNLGFDCGEVDGVLGPKTQAAIEQFQATHDLDVTGKLDAATLDKLKQAHDKGTES